jgi:hypothetical protein
MGMGNVIRFVKFAKYFPQFGWEPVIITSTPRTYYCRDDYLLSEMNNRPARVYRTPIRSKVNLLNTHKLKRLRNDKIRRFFSIIPQFYKIPDAVKSWENKAVKLASEVIDSEKIDIIFSTAPPFTDFLAGVQLKKKYGIPLVVDYRDSWQESPARFYPTRLHRFANAKKELEMLRIADVVLTVNRRIKELLIEQYPNVTHKDINIIPYGYDQEDFDGLATQLPRTNKMRITHAGNFFDLMTPKYFFEGLSLVFKRRPELKRKIEACFLGLLSKQNESLISKYDLGEAVYYPGYVNHRECIKYLLASDILWFTIGKGRRGKKEAEVLSPMRLSEYFGARKPIIASIPEGAAKGMLRYYEAVKICEPDKPEEIADSIIEYYDLFEKNFLPKPKEEVILRHDIKQLTYQLVRYFEFLIDITPQSDFKGKKINQPVHIS